MDLGLLLVNNVPGLQEWSNALWDARGGRGETHETPILSWPDGSERIVFTEGLLRTMAPELALTMPARIALSHCHPLGSILSGSLLPEHC